jgi:hypothetical protein
VNLFRRRPLGVNKVRKEVFFVQECDSMDGEKVAIQKAQEKGG